MSERELAKRGAGRDEDERARSLKQSQDLAPVAHQRFELVERIDSFGAREGDHACAAGRHGRDLGAVFLYVPVPGDDQPSLAGGLGYPDVIARGGVGDRAGTANPAALDFATRVAGVRNVSSHLYEDLGQTEDIGVEVELDER